MEFDWIAYGLGVVSSIILIYLKSILDSKAKRLERKLDDKRKKLELLREILGYVIPFAEEGISEDWNIPGMSQEQIKEKKLDYRNKATHALAYFIGEKDSDVFQALSALVTFLFTSAKIEAPQGENWEKRGKPLVTAEDMSDIDSAGVFVLNRIVSGRLPQVRLVIEKAVRNLEKEATET